MHLKNLLTLSIALGTCMLASADETNPIYTSSFQQPVSSLQSSHLETRGAPDYRCGPDHGRCSRGTCCSRSVLDLEILLTRSTGFCGTSKAHCRSPDCQLDYGHCDTHKMPKGPPPTKSLVPYGPMAIRSCTVPGTIAFTFDDGPTQYTGDLLDLLDRYGAKATFFITGNNNGKGQIDDKKLPWMALIERIQRSGHQIASHTWSHEDLSKVTAVQRRDQILKNEAALRNIVGHFPTYMRPPYSSCDPASGCGDELGGLGYHIILYDIDTEDYKNDNPGRIQLSKDIFDRALGSASPYDKSWLVIAHDAHEQTVHNLTEHMLKTASELGYRPVTVGECLRDSPEHWYRRDDRGPTNKKGSKSGKVCGNSSESCVQNCQKNTGYCPVEIPSEGDAKGSRVPNKSSKSDADADLRTIGSATVTSLLLALIVAMLM
ncbi:hypothetical protein N7510_007880 [Penicillium lagena]|uniref:uncharacterized protein n=1 Tax=Penicillium lagena TaxID=94218 RepID=UPI002540A368|nr:uncharacterized protein N7510_007880 [Penicillium lagena]KAJ5611161.1 hypothetical protein N7510_007880 [Penicillium lagena]